MENGAKAADWIAYHATASPSRTAVIDMESGRMRTYAELNARIYRLASYLHISVGLPRGARVLVISKNDADIFEIQFACQRAGLIFVPLNWRLTEREIVFIAIDSGADVLFFGPEFRSVADALVTGGGVQRTIELTQGREGAYERAIADSAPLSNTVPNLETDCWALIYTSGTTGHPKGAMITYRMALYNAITLCSAFDIDGASRNLVLLPLFHTGGLNVFANPIFFRGGTNVIMRDFDPRRVVGMLADGGGITHLMAVPTMHGALAGEPGFEQLSGSGLRGIAVAGAACPLAIIDAYAQVGLPLRQCWGMTEAGPLGLLMPPHNPAEKRGSSGLPSPFLESAILSADGRPVEDGAVGELVVRGPHVTCGYWRHDEANREAFDADGWFHTGDAAYRDADGYHYIVDRWKDMYISGGENIYPAEIERVMLMLDDIAECAVVGKPDEKWGEVGRAYVVFKGPVRRTDEDLAAHCGKHLARYKIPKEFVPIDALPRNASGKILKKTLRTMT